jgi:hypothetical protein
VHNPYLCGLRVCLFVVVFVRVKEHKKDPQLLLKTKQYFAYWLETTYRADPHEQIVVLFDMADAGISNMVGARTFPCITAVTQRVYGKYSGNELNLHMLIDNLLFKLLQLTVSQLSTRVQ